jgi:hypothetical protein
MQSDLEGRVARHSQCGPRDLKVYLQAIED